MAKEVNDFVVSNIRLAQKVMSSGKCQCKPEEKCPCKEFVKDGKCRCGVFWDFDQTEFTKGEKKILKVIRDKINEQCEKAGV